MSINVKSGLVDFFYLLKRRNVPFERWCKSSGIQTRLDFQLKKTEIEAQGEYFFGPEMEKLCLSLPPEPQELPEEQKPSQESPAEPLLLPDPSEAQETHSPPKKNRK